MKTAEYLYILNAKKHFWIKNKYEKNLRIEKKILKSEEKNIKNIFSKEIISNWWIKKYIIWEINK